MLKKIILSIVFMGIFGAKSQVLSTSYSLMLKGLLRHSVPELNVTKAALLQEQGVIFIDTREKKEYQISTIRHAVFVGYDSLDLSPTVNIPKNTPLVVYCSVGYRSEKVAEKLIKEGFTEVYNLYGGIFEWVNQGKKVYKNEQETQQVHGFTRVWGIWLNKGEKVYK
jgi:rhodanese-related sulfurtransferase